MQECDVVRNICKGEFGMEGKVYFRLFDKYIDLSFAEDIPMEYVEKCAQKLNSLDEEIVLVICKYSIDFCEDVMINYDEVNYPECLAELSCNTDILKYIQPISLIVDEPDDMKIAAINLYCKCAWDTDNDMQILINNDKVIYVGVYDGLDPWQKKLSEWGNYVIGYRL